MNFFPTNKRFQIVRLRKALVLLLKLLESSNDEGDLLRRLILLGDEKDNYLLVIKMVYRIELLRFNSSYTYPSHSADSAM